jgi:hypothetical protein
MNTGAILTALMLGVLLASAASWAIAALYRRRMLALMRQQPAPRIDALPVPLPAPAKATRRTVSPDAAAQRAAGTRQLIALAAVGLLIGLSHSVLALLFLYGDDLLSPGRALTLGLVYAWPVLLTWGLARRWSWARTWAAVAVYLLLMLWLVQWRSIEPQALARTAGWLAGLVLIPTAVTLLIGASPRIRAIAPYLLPLGLLLAAGTIGIQLWQIDGVNDPPRWVMALVGTLGVWPALLLIALLPWAVLAWPAWWLARALAQAYRRKRFSDLGYLVAAYWAVVLAASALPSLQGAGWIGLIALLPWLWLPLAQWALRGWLAPRVPPPTLLVLRVFQQDAAVQTLFDRVIERWRLTGNTLLIAGTDLLSRTIDPDDVFTFLDGRLAQRFVTGDADLAERIRAFDLDPDPDGRYRVNECYCHDSSWQAALAVLVQRADTVLMDLRGFQAHNAGCRHELGVLARATHLQRVVVLVDERTDRATAETDAAAAPAGRFVWVSAGRLGGRQAGEVLAALVAR